jgi:hypothetical protein
MEYLAHSASFHSLVNTAPSKRGIKHLGTVIEARETFAELGSICSEIRRQRRLVRVLLELGNLPPLAPEIAAEIAAAIEAAHVAGDRVAIVMQNSLAKMRLRQFITQATMETFVSPAAAQTWLFAHDYCFLLGKTAAA